VLEPDNLPSLLESVNFILGAIGRPAPYTPHVFGNVFGLREISFPGDANSLHLAQRIMTTAAKPIEHVAWRFYHSRYYFHSVGYDPTDGSSSPPYFATSLLLFFLDVPELNLGTTSNLRFLSMSVSAFHSLTGRADLFQADWRGMLGILSDPSISRNLEEVPIAILLGNVDWEVLALDSVTSWSELDNALSSIAKIQKVKIYTDGRTLIHGSYVALSSSPTLRDALVDRFHLLREKGVIVSSHGCSMDALDFRRQ
jgi:hypothetical protein